MKDGRNAGYVQKEGIRIVYNSTGCYPVQIRQFDQNAKIGYPVNAYELIYDDKFNLINILYINGPMFVNNLDIRVPEKPIITSVNNTEVSGTCIGDVVKNGDKIDIIDINTKKVLGTGTINLNAFTVSIDLSSYDIGTVIKISALAWNEVRTHHGTSESADVVDYTKV